ncbi:MAG: hypothetical protein LC624_03540, partial [Halobacteriales archaeon]|nr:hypothetical protein [Halobacteriales archaeon]
VAKALAERPVTGIAVTKDTLNRPLDMGLDEALAWDARIQALCMLHPDFLEAYKAFTEKRPARYAKQRQHIH